MRRKVAVIGVGYTKSGHIHNETRESSQLAFSAIKSALTMAGISIADIDAAAFCSVDGFEATNRIDRTIDAFGQGYNKPVLMVHTGGTAGASGFKEAYDFIAAGLYDIMVVYGSNTFGGTIDAQQILNTAIPPLFEKKMAVGAIQVAGLNATRYMHEYGATEYDYALVAAKSHKAGARNPNAHVRKGYSVEEILDSPVIAWPLRLHEICPVSSGTAALVLASEGKAEELSDTPVWIKAVDKITDTWMSGYRSYNNFEALKVLSQRVYREVGIKNPLKQIDVAELFNVFSPFELWEYEDLGFCDEGHGIELVREGITDIDGELPVNMSGGMLCTNAGIASSVSRIGDVVLQLMGKFEGIQVKSPETGLVHIIGGNHWQFQFLSILSNIK